MSYFETFRRFIDEIHVGLLADLTVAAQLEGPEAEKLLRYLLDLACKAQNSANIRLGRLALRDLPRSWVVPRVAPAAMTTLDLADAWQLRRFLEVCCLLDAKLAEQQAAGFLQASDPELREIATDFSGRCGSWAETLSNQYLNDSLI